MSDHIAPSPARFSRRQVLRTSAQVALAAVASGSIPLSSVAGPRRYEASRLRAGVIGCGGRGTGAADNLLEASPDVEIVALADLFPDRLAQCRAQLADLSKERGGRATVPAERCFAGFDAYHRLLEEDVDLVVLAAPPHFRPMHLAAAVAKGCHVFAEKPVAVDPSGARSVLESAHAAEQKDLSIVAGTQRRHERSYLESVDRVRGGDVGTIVGARCYWNQGGLWMKPREPSWSDAEWQLRNWLYFTWLSGDHIVEQHVHNLDVVNWALGAAPLKCWGMGGRQVRTGPEYGHVFDHFAVEYEYPGGVVVQSFCRQIDGCVSRVEEAFDGTDGRLTTTPGRGRIEGGRPWAFEGDNPNPYVQEQADLIRAITRGEPLNEAKSVAESTLTAIMGRMAAYTGKTVTWDAAMNSRLDLTPSVYELGTLPVSEVAVPGKTPLL